MRDDEYPLQKNNDCPYIRNRCNDSLNRYSIHQSVERFARRWERLDYSLTSQYALRNHCNVSLNRCNALQDVDNVLTSVDHL
jgi:hypothetical protein